MTPHTSDSSQTRPCKVCGERAPEVFRIPRTKAAGREIPDAPDDCPYFECENCRFCFTDILDGAEASQLYDEAYWTDHDPDWHGKTGETLRLVLLANALVKGDPSKLEILDFGCGMGAFVQTAREKLDLRTWGHDVIEPRLGREFFLRALPTSRFDVVVCCEVLEHLPRPVETLSQIVRSLRPRGAIAFQTAHYDPKVCGRDWWYVGPANGHVSLFSAAALDVIFAKLEGKHRMVWNDYPGIQAWQF